MNDKLDHIALRGKVLSESISYYRILAENLGYSHGRRWSQFLFYQHQRRGGDPVVVESQTESGINHYGFVADDMNKVVAEIAQRMPKFCARSATPMADWPLYLCAIGARNSFMAAPILTLLVAELNLDS